MRKVVWWRVGGRSRNQRRMIGGIHIAPTNPDYEQVDSDFNYNDDSVDECRFFCAPDKQQRDQQQNKDSRDGHHAHYAARVMLEWEMPPLIGNAPPKPLLHN